MKKRINPVSKSLAEVWKWKDEVYNDIKDKTYSEKRKYYDEGIEMSLKILNASLIKNPDGSYSIK